MTESVDRVRVAVASKDGISINQHFGHAREFLVFLLDNQGVHFQEKREVGLYCLGGEADQSVMPAILKTLADCDAVFVAKVGDGPAGKLAKQGTEAVESFAYLGIEASLAEFHRARAGVAD